ncbi:MAG TPA: MFS transporter [Vicinamibacterales bacterium]|jgi:AAHS family 4-hydroxybenzoate transporter-like MFS transporter
MDGFDVQSIGYVAPAIITDWKIANADMGPVFSAGLLGLFLGSLVFSMVADRIGRRPVVLGATLAFSMLTLLTARASSITELIAVRFLAGLGLGAILPNATALVGEFSPPRHRIKTMMIVTNGFTIGAMIGGFLSAWLIPRYGWRSVFVAGGVIPLVILVPMFFSLPESPQFRAPVGAVSPGSPKLGTSEGGRRSMIARLFADGRAFITIVLWIVNFLNVLNAYSVSSWLPTLVRDAGYPTSTAVLAGTSVQTGGVLGTIALGWVIQRVGFVPVLTGCFTLAAINLALIGQHSLSVSMLFVVTFLAGLGIFAGQPGLNALAATVYPTDIRSTGIGSGLGIGRFGAFLGPVLAGELMRRHWTTQDLFHAAAIPAALSAVAILGAGLARRVPGGTLE